MKEEKEIQPVRVWEATLKNPEGVYEFLYYAANSEKHAREKAMEDGGKLINITELIPNEIVVN